MQYKAVIYFSFNFAWYFIQLDIVHYEQGDFFFFETSGNSIFTKTTLDLFGPPLSYLFSSIFNNFFFSFGLEQLLFISCQNT